MGHWNLKPDLISNTSPRTTDCHARSSTAEIQQRIQDAAEYLERCLSRRPRLGLILGTGLGDITSHMEPCSAIPYEQVPHFCHSTAIGHRGRFVVGDFAGVPTIAMDGRCHLYEGYSADDVAMGARVMQRLGTRALVITNASGGLNPKLASGDILVLTGHLNFLGRRSPTPLTSDGSASLRNGTGPYCPLLVDLALQSARQHDFFAMPGVYASVLGPNYETRAEYRFLRRVGGDVVGMSTVPEVLAVAQHGMRVLALSVVTNVAKPDAQVATDAHDVVSLAAQAAVKLAAIIRDVARAEA